ncbi:MAG: N-(5'-phosphoribosyl)anthranilate isomerase [Formosa sp. Hel3_A1_48]|nr:MAG: N-(5'-phosphoribosyl)anthranilate isomerase [Formosa sp. Hel3_A1_48]
MKLKVCGMKYRDNILKVAALKPDYMGFIFYEKSLRFVCEDIPVLPNDIKKVGVFVDASIEKIKEMREKFNLNVVQLHGHESPEFCQKLRNEHIEIIKVFSVENEFDFSKLKVYEPHVSYFLFDTKGPNPGGNGYSFDWTILQNYNSNTPYFLSGGIGLEDIEALNHFQKSAAAQQCYAIDVNSKFETKPAYKDSIKLKKFIETL